MMLGIKPTLDMSPCSPPNTRCLSFSAQSRRPNLSSLCMRQELHHASQIHWYVLISRLLDTLSLSNTNNESLQM
jgi:hypothetical protein